MKTLAIVLLLAGTASAQTAVLTGPVSGSFRLANGRWDNPTPEHLLARNEVRMVVAWSDGDVMVKIGPPPHIILGWEGNGRLRPGSLGRNRLEPDARPWAFGWPPGRLVPRFGPYTMELR